MLAATEEDWEGKHLNTFRKLEARTDENGVAVVTGLNQRETWFRVEHDDYQLPIDQTHQTRFSQITLMPGRTNYIGVILEERPK